MKVTGFFGFIGVTTNIYAKLVIICPSSKIVNDLGDVYFEIEFDLLKIKKNVKNNIKN